MRCFFGVGAFTLFTVFLANGCALSHRRPEYQVMVDCNSTASIPNSEIITPQALFALYQVVIIPDARPIAALSVSMEVHETSDATTGFFRRFGDWFVTSGSAYTRRTAHGPQQLVQSLLIPDRARVTIATPTVASLSPISFTIRADISDETLYESTGQQFLINLQDIKLIYADTGELVPWEEIEFLSCDSGSSRAYTLY